MRTLDSLFSLEGRTAVITGAGGHLGLAVCEAFAEQGAGLILVDKNKSSLNKVAGSLMSNWGVTVNPFTCNLEDPEQRSNLVAQIRTEFQSIEILVNNAAFVGTSDIDGWAVAFQDQSIEAWRRAIEVNLTTAFHLCQGLHSLLDTSRKGSIINIGSIYGENGPDWDLYEGTTLGNPAAYAASKGGLLQLTRWLSTTLAPNIRVNAISPGGLLRGQDPMFVAKYEKRTPLGRMAVEEDLKGASIFLASDASSYVTGQVVRVDGGWSAW